MSHARSRRPCLRHKEAGVVDPAQLPQLEVVAGATYHLVTDDEKIVGYFSRIDAMDLPGVFRIAEAVYCQQAL